MKNWYLNPDTKDVELDLNFNLKFTTSLKEYVAQKIENVLRTFKNEWFLNRDLGLPYYDRILIKNADINDVNNLLRAAVMGIFEIIQILEFDSVYDTETRVYSVSFKAKASDETTTEEVEGVVVI